jgi:hypothetical protein
LLKPVHREKNCAFLLRKPLLRSGFGWIDKDLIMNQHVQNVIRNCGFRCGVTITVMLALVGVYAWSEVRAGWTPAKVEKEAKSALPYGSTKREVMLWLQTNGFQDIHSGSAKKLDYFETRDGISLEGAKDVIYGKTPHPNVGLICKGNITVFFFFDLDERLVKMHVQTWICSL